MVGAIDEVENSLEISAKLDNVLIVLGQSHNFESLKIRCYQDCFGSYTLWKLYMIYTLLSSKIQLNHWNTVIIRYDLISYFFN